MHDNFMLAALEQAQLERGFCSPNPAVGAVAVVDNKIVARASHKGAGTPHAEILILNQLGAEEKSVTLYVTLEPCNHWGQTPPCIEAIIAAKVERVVYAYADPNPLVSQNNTPALLRAKGIEVIHNPIAKIDRFYQSYTYWMTHKKPWLTAKIAQSLDGKIAGTGGKRIDISNQQCAHFTHMQRRQADAILSTATTIINDEPQLTARMNDKTYARPLAILDSNLRLTAQSRALQLAAHCYIFHAETVSVREPVPNCTYYPVAVVDGKLDLPAVIAQLGKLGFHDVWVEAGGTLFSTLHQQQLLQRSYIYLAPVVLGPDAVPAFPLSCAWPKAAAVNWRAFGDNIIGRFDWRESTCSPE